MNYFRAVLPQSNLKIIMGLKGCNIVITVWYCKVMCCFYFHFLKGVEFNEQLIKELKQKGNKIIWDWFMFR